jgi:hypothetical protein
VPNALERPGDFADAVARLVKRFKIDVLLPNAEASLLAALARRDEISAILPWPALSVFRSVCDKAQVTMVAESS